MAPPQDLRRILPWWQIVLLAISAIIGVTIFSTIGTVLHTASTAGTLIALGIVGAIAIFVMASLGELVVLWPVPNALVEYVKYFVDEDVATVVGVTYWYTWSSVFTNLLIAAYDFSCMLIERPMHRVGIFVGIGFGLTLINGLGVKAYGWIEAIGGIIKFVNAIAGAIFLCVALHLHGAANNPAVGSSDEAANWFVALCMSIPTLTYGLLGVEVVAVTAFEAYDRRSLRWPVRWIAWIMTVLYLFVAIPGTILVYWQDDLLVERTTVETESSVSRRGIPPTPSDQCFQRYPYMVLAAYRYGSPGAATYFDLCIIYFCISAANTALYVASRTLYGIFRPLGQAPARSLPWWQQLRDLPRSLGTLSSRQVPVAALVVSALSWVWLVGLRAVNYNVVSLMALIGSTGGVMVWFLECCAYISYYAWLQRTNLPDSYDRSSRAFRWQRQRPFLSSLQPYIAWAGAAGCLVIGFVLCSAPWWQGDRPTIEILGVYGGPLLMFLLFLGLKARRKLFSRVGGIEATGRDIYLILEDLSGLPLDREPRVPDDAERVAGEAGVASKGSNIGAWLTRKRPGAKQRVQTAKTELEFPTMEPDATGVERREGTADSPRLGGVLRSRTWEQAQ